MKRIIYEAAIKLFELSLSNKKQYCHTAWKQASYKNLNDDEDRLHGNLGKNHSQNP